MSTPTVETPPSIRGRSTSPSPAQNNTGVAAAVAAASASTSSSAPKPPTTPFPSERDYVLRDMRLHAAIHTVRASGSAEALALLDAGALSSQHHLSAYSKLKWGPLGAPWAYLPITLVDPQAVQTAAEQQYRADQAAAQRQLRVGKHPGARREAVLASPSGSIDSTTHAGDSKPQYEVTLADAHRAALAQGPWIAPPSVPTPAVPDPSSVASLQGSAIKTSASHPVRYVTLATLHLLSRPLDFQLRMTVE